MKTIGKFLFYLGCIVFLAFWVCLTLFAFHLKINADIMTAAALFSVVCIIVGSLINSQDRKKTLVRNAIFVLAVLFIVVAATKVITDIGTFLLLIAILIFVRQTRNYWRVEGAAECRMNPNRSNSKLYNELKDTGIATTATILDSQADGGRFAGTPGNQTGGTRFMNLTISFTDNKSNVHTANIRYEIDNSLIANFIKGKEISIIYDADNTERIVIDTEKCQIDV
ncbi:MAG: hypothetical protein FWD70_00115 [Desulfuromonadales bacterium]|nr:hypothetical protein [Desulfuromonadales bacterium]